MRRAPARPVRACFVWTCCTVVVQEHDLRATPVKCNSKRALSSHFTLHSSHPDFTLHICTSSHLKSCELFSPHLTSSHLIPSLPTCCLSKFFSTGFISSGHWSTFLISKFFSTHLSCSARRKALNVREKVSCTKKTLQNTLSYKACTKHVPVLLCTTKFAQSTSQYDFVLQSLHKARPSNTLYYKACAGYFPVLLSTTKFAQSTSQYDFVLQSLHRVLPSTTLHDKACTKHFPVLLCTTKLAQGTSQYFFVLQSLHKALPSTTSYYKACTKYFPASTTSYYKACKEHVPVLLRTTELAQRTSQYYFVLQSLHKALPSTTSYYKACFPVLLCTTKLAQSTSQYILLCTTKLKQSTSPYFFVLQSLHKALPSTTLYYKACKEYVPVILYCKACTTKLAPVLFLKKLLSASPPAIERWPQGSLMCILGGSPRESRREKKEKKNKKNKKGRRRQKP